MEFSDFSRLILRYENVENKHSSLVQSINSLEDAEEKKVPLVMKNILIKWRREKTAKNSFYLKKT
ncbi:hypothetical protein P4571_22920 [Niallia alba]|uniref:hypothetical protein n=1 Tax=Niallia alba TaxID=2729105 RepID=UPI002E229E79|nr:hypothetical protein [Niallia alba]